MNGHNQLAETAVHYRQIVEDLPVLFCRVSPDGRLLYVNAAYCQYFQQPKEALLGTHFLQYVPEWDRQKIQKVLATLHPRHATISFENRMVLDDEEIRWQTWTIRAIYSGKDLVEYQASLVDITDSKKISALKLEQHLFTKVMLEISTILNNTLDFEAVLHSILENLRRVLTFDSANIMLLDKGYTHVVAHWGYYEPALRRHVIESRYWSAETPNFREMLKSKQPIVVADMEPYLGATETVIVQNLRSYMGAPIMAAQEVIGFLNVDSRKHAFFNEVQATRLQLFADQAGVAIRNAQLYEKAQALAIVEERQRLAQELHDAVSQTLFSASVLAEALPKVYEKSPDKLPGLLQELHAMTRGALVEMQTLLIELRPDALLEMPLQELIQRLGESFSQRHGITVTLEIDGDTPLPPQVQLALYRVFQEALSNIAKHALANSVRIRLQMNEQQVHLAIHDDGQGYTSPQSTAGITLMRERAAEIGAHFQLQMQAGQGTTISVTWTREFVYE